MIANKYKTYSKLHHCIMWIVEVWQKMDMEEYFFTSETDADAFMTHLYD